MPTNSLEYQKEYRKNHQKEILEYNRKYRIENGEHLRMLERLRYHENPERFREANKKYYYKDVEKTREKKRLSRQQVHEEALRVLGDKCFFCQKSSRKLLIHTKSGEPHLNNLAYSIVNGSVDVDDFVLLCRGFCHKAVHWCMRNLGFTWERIEFVRKEFLDEIRH